MHHIYDHQHDKVMAVNTNTHHHTPSQTQKEKLSSRVAKKKKVQLALSRDPIFIDIHAEATLLSTPVQLLVNTNISSANPTY